VRDGDIDLADGLVSTETLLRLYPQARLEDSGLLERVVEIRDDAFARRLRERLLPSQEVLAQRLFRQSQELADTAAPPAALPRAGARAARRTAACRRRRWRRGRPRLLALQHQLNDGLARALATESVDRLDVMDDMLKMVSAQVTLRPSGHQFAVEGHDTLLQAGLRAGLKLNYGCGNGSCGMCKVRVTDGQVVRTMHTDYALSETEKDQGYVLSCAHTAASSELTIETLEAAGPEDIPAQQIVTTVRALRPLAPDTLLLHLQTPRSHRLRFLAGQAVTLGCHRGRWRRPACHCTPSPVAPATTATCSSSSRATPDDPMATQLFEGGVKVGDASRCTARRRLRAGRQCTPAGLRGLRHRHRTGQEPDRACAVAGQRAVDLAVLAGDAADGHFIANQCRAWSEALDPSSTPCRPTTDAATGASLMASAMRADLFDIDCTYYIAGPADFRAPLWCAELGAAGVADGLHSEVIG
jgi:CDP-4-dehydro-6-deoxyglucose reductase